MGLSLCWEYRLLTGSIVALLLSHIGSMCLGLCMCLSLSLLLLSRSLLLLVMLMRIREIVVWGSHGTRWRYGVDHGCRCEIGMIESVSG